MDINNISTIALKGTGMLTLATLTACACTLTWKFSGVSNQVNQTLSQVKTVAKKASDTIDQIDRVVISANAFLDELDKKGLGNVVENCAAITGDAKGTVKHICETLRYIFSQEGAHELVNMSKTPAMESLLGILNKLPRILSLIDQKVGGGLSTVEMKTKLDNLTKKYEMDLDDSTKNKIAEQSAAWADFKVFGCGIDDVGYLLLSMIISGKEGTSIDTQTMNKIEEGLRQHCGDDVNIHGLVSALRNADSRATDNQ